MERNSSAANYLIPGTKIIYYLPESLRLFIGYINKRYKPYRETNIDLYYLVNNGDHSVESVSIVPEQILGYVSKYIWIDIDTGSSTTICDIVRNFCRRFGIPDLKDDSVDSIRYTIASGKYKEYKKKYRRYYDDIPTYDLSASSNKKMLPSPSERLKKKLKRIEVNGEYMTAVWYDHPATVIKLSEYDMYDTEKAYMWLLLKGLCDNNKSECDRVLKLMEDITFEKK